VCAKVITKEGFFMLEGFWTVEFGSSTGMFGGAVLWCKQGEISGGDSGYYFVGRYESDSNTFTATIRSMPFIDGYVSVFNTKDQDLILDLTGVVDGNQATAQGHPRGMPEMRFGAKLTRRVAEDLPK
jgi:hypothetical protein